jgi:hypothetical protein
MCTKTFSSNVEYLTVNMFYNQGNYESSFQWDSGTFLKFYFIVVMGWEVHCGIYKGSYNVSNISQLK